MDVWMGGWFRLRAGGCYVDVLRTGVMSGGSGCVDVWMGGWFRLGVGVDGGGVVGVAGGLLRAGQIKKTASGWAVFYGHGARSAAWVWGRVCRGVTVAGLGCGQGACYVEVVRASVMSWSGLGMTGWWGGLFEG